MSALAMQTVIAKLCADFKFRQDYLNDPDAMLGQYELTTEEIESVKALDMPLVQDYASSLVSKRMSLIKKWFGLTFTYLESRLSHEEVHQLVHSYGVETYRDQEELGGEWLRGESKRFYDYLRQHFAGGDERLPYFSDLMEYEFVSFLMRNSREAHQSSVEINATNPAMARPTLEGDFLLISKPLVGKHARACAFQYNVPVLIEFLRGEKPLPDLPKEPTCCLFLRGTQQQNVVPTIISQPLKDLIDMCTGEHTTEEVVSAVAQQHASLSGFATEDLRADCLNVLGQLYDLNVLTFVGMAAQASTDESCTVA
jgi:hypothetical protein